eukprot:Platyproteum_vivax@DN5510_c0_g1_i1.p1
MATGSYQVSIVDAVITDKTEVFYFQPFPNVQNPPKAGVYRAHLLLDKKAIETEKNWCALRYLKTSSRTHPQTDALPFNLIMSFDKSTQSQSQVSKVICNKCRKHKQRASSQLSMRLLTKKIEGKVTEFGYIYLCGSFVFFSDKGEPLLEATEVSFCSYSHASQHYCAANCIQVLIRSSSFFLPVEHTMGTVELVEKGSPVKEPPPLTVPHSNVLYRHPAIRPNLYMPHNVKLNNLQMQAMKRFYPPALPPPFPIMFPLTDSSMLSSNKLQGLQADQRFEHNRFMSPYNSHSAPDVWLPAGLPNSMPPPSHLPYLNTAVPGVPGLVPGFNGLPPLICNDVEENRSKKLKEEASEEAPKSPAVSLLPKIDTVEEKDNGKGLEAAAVPPCSSNWSLLTPPPREEVTTPNRKRSRELVLFHPYLYAPDTPLPLRPYPTEAPTPHSILMSLPTSNTPP